MYFRELLEETRINITTAVKTLKVETDIEKRRKSSKRYPTQKEISTLDALSKIATESKTNKYGKNILKFCTIEMLTSILKVIPSLQ